MLVELRLGGDLAGYLQRARDDGQSWRKIAADVSRRTGMKVSHESMREWHKRTSTAVAA